MKKVIIIFFTFHVSLIQADWVNVTNGINNLNINALTATGSYIFAGNDQFVYRSSNNGDNWQQIYNLPGRALASFGSYIYMGYNNGVGRSTNYGTNWSYAGLNQWTLCLLSNGNNIYAGCFWPVPGGSTNRGVWLSTNYGANWTQTALNNVDIYSLTVSGSYLFAGGYNTGVAGGVFVSSNNGQNWTNPLLIGGDALVSSSNYIYTGVDGSPYGVYKSTNYGLNWSQTSLNNVGVHALAIYGNFVFAGASNGVYVSSDNGTTWIQRNEGMGNKYTISICTYNGFIFIGTSGQGVWRRQLSELVGVKPISNEVPQKFILYQNYPNPFNPVTKIKFDIPPNRPPFDKGGWTKSGGFVKLTIYDVLGREVATLVNQQLTPGTYEVEWDGSDYPSGVYFYRLTVTDASTPLSITKKMVLLK